MAWRLMPEQAPERHPRPRRVWSRHPPAPVAARAPRHRSPLGRDRSSRPAAKPAPLPAAHRPSRPAMQAGCRRSGTPASVRPRGVRTGSLAPRRARACAPPAAGRGPRGCHPARPPAPGSSTRTRPCSPRSGPPACRCACAGSARMDAGGRSATARSGQRARPAQRPAVRRSTANLAVRTWVRTWCDAHGRGRGSEPQAFCGFQAAKCDGGCEPECDGCDG
jgi:hypothetical protein